MFERCEGCPVPEGACWPRRANVRRVCELPSYRAAIARWGVDGGPAAGPPEPESVQEARRASLEADRAFYLSLPAETRQRAAECPHRRREPSGSCCGGEVDVCRGGPLDGRHVQVIDCARCTAAGRPGAYVVPG
jgi:hypothetical protein